MRIRTLVNSVVTAAMVVVAIAWSPPSQAATTVQTNPPPASTQQIGFAPDLVYAFNLNVSNGWNSATNSFQLGRAATISVQLSWSNNTANVSNETCTVQTSNDQVNWVTRSVMTKANTGTTTASMISNVTASADGFARIFVSNAATNSTTADGTAFLTNLPAAYINMKDGL